MSLLILTLCQVPNFHWLFSLIEENRFSLIKKLLWEIFSSLRVGIYFWKRIYSTITKKKTKTKTKTNKQKNKTHQKNPPEKPPLPKKQKQKQKTKTKNKPKKTTPARKRSVSNNKKTFDFSFSFSFFESFFLNNCGNINNLWNVFLGAVFFVRFPLKHVLDLVLFRFVSQAKHKP